MQEKETKLDKDDLSKFHDILNTLLRGRTGDKLKIAELIVKDKGDCALWLEKMATFLRNDLAKNSNNFKYLNFLKGVQKTYKIIKSTNVSQRAALENLFLSF